MSVILFTAPPLPHYIVSGKTPMPIGSKHPNRQNIGIFDLLIVTKGCLYVGEDEHDYEVAQGYALLLRPDKHHYAYSGCLEETTHYWLHFNILGEWTAIGEETYRSERDTAFEEETQRPVRLSAFSTTSYTVALPQFVKLAQPQKLTEVIDQLIMMDQSTHLSGIRLKQQALFQEVILLLSASLRAGTPSPQSVCAERAASYLRENYKESFSAKRLGESINFHPVYIARCMQRMFGCPPAVYQLQVRIEQAKLLLLQTNLTVERIAEEVGFNQPAYFTSSFTKIEGLSPRKYRQRFTWTRE
ncbi:helix-turn-helix domain-containing protein [Paenibacillus sp. GCM10012307]|uniref:Helix-turn-helix transcriptional regulator n=1 Tax=Paenibacillus roseus TaxID=2798579 RepID=A0A934MPS0_9BACL|nr:AraC family transcriptional regulator [Paenibacillus roseus]MBJ6360684.1 helix-turn-helix transcriptional regulator [Paenibacillus roseus]